MHFFLTDILTRHVYCPGLESIQSVLVFAEFCKHQMMSALMFSRSLHADAAATTMEAKVELSTMTEKDEVHTTCNSVATKIGITQSSSLSISVQPIFQPLDATPLSGGLGGASLAGGK